MHNVQIYKGCVIQQYGYNLYVWRDSQIVHQELDILEAKVILELSKIVTMIDEGEI